MPPLFFIMENYNGKATDIDICGFFHSLMKEKRKAHIFRYTLSSVSDMIRTRGLLIRSQTLYPAELHSHIHLAQELSYIIDVILSSTFLKRFKKWRSRSSASPDPYLSFVVERSAAAFLREVRTSFRGIFVMPLAAFAPMTRGMAGAAIRTGRSPLSSMR